MAEDLGSLVLRLGLDGSGFNSGITELNRQMRVVQTGFQATRAGLGELGTGLDALRLRSTTLTTQMGTQQTKVALLEEAHRRSVAALGADARATQELEIRLNNARAELSNMDNELRRTNDSIRTQSSILGKLGIDCRQLGAAFTAAGVSIAVALGAAVKTTMDFDAEMSKVKALAGATGVEFEKLRQQAIDLGAKSSFSASQSAAGMQKLAAAGFNANQIMAAMPGVLNATAASGADMTLVAETMAGALNAFGLEASKSGHVANVLAQAANASAIDVSDMSYSLKYAGPVAKSLGVSLEETTAALIEMGNASIKGEQAGSTLRSAMLNLADPPKEAATQLHNMGISIQDIHGSMLPLGDIIGQLNTKMSGMTEVQKAATLSTIFGKEAVSGMMVLIDQGKDKFDQYTQSLLKSDGAAKTAADTMKDNLKGTMDNLQGSLESAAIAIGTALIPAIKEVAEKIGDLVDWFNKLSPQTKEYAALAAALGSAVLVVGGAVLMLAGAMPVLSAGIGIVTGAFVALDVATGGLLIAIGLAVTGLIAAGVYIYNNWEEVKVRFLRAMNSWAYGFATAWNFMKQKAIESVISMIDAVSKVTDLFPKVGDKVNDLKGAMTQLLAEVKNDQSIRDNTHALEQHEYILRQDYIATKDLKTAQEDVVESSMKLRKENQAGTEVIRGKAVASQSAADAAKAAAKAEKEAAAEAKKAFDDAMQRADYDLKMGTTTLTQYIAVLEKIKVEYAKTEDDIQKVGLAIKAANDEITKKTEEAAKAQFDFSKKWIADKKEMNELSAAEEMAAWKRVADRYADGTKEKLEADKNYYKAKNDLDKKAREDAIKEADKLGEAIVTALKKQYDAEEKIDSDALDKKMKESQAASDDLIKLWDRQAAEYEKINQKQVDDARNASDARIKGYEDEYNAKLKLLDSETFDKVKAVQDQIDGIKGQTDLENKQLEEQAFNTKKAELTKKIEHASSLEEMAQAQQDLNDFVAQRERELLLESRNAQIDALKQSIDDIKDAATKKKDTLKQEIDDKKAAEKAQLDATIDRLNNEKELTRANYAALVELQRNHEKDVQDGFKNEKIALTEHYNSLTAEDALQAKARKLALDQNNKELVELLSTYNPQWQNAGQSFGQSLLEGLNSTKSSVQAAVDNILALVNQARSAAAGIAGTMVSTMRSDLQIHSPSKVMKEIGAFTGEGFAIGIQDSMKNVSSAAKQLSTAAIPSGASSMNKGSSLGNIQIMVTGNNISGEADENRLADKISQKFAKQFGLSVGGVF